MKFFDFLLYTLLILVLSALVAPKIYDTFVPNFTTAISLMLLFRNSFD